MPDIIQRLLTQNDCYRAGRTMKPKGIMVHSLGVAQPDPEVFIRSWDRPGVEVAVHAIVGAESITQLLPWHWRGWHAGTGTSGQSANNTHISFECCEPAGHTYQGGTMIGYDAPANDGYFRAVYRNAVELAAGVSGVFHIRQKHVYRYVHAHVLRLGDVQNLVDVTVQFHCFSFLSFFVLCE